MRRSMARRRRSSSSSSSMMTSPSSRRAMHHLPATFLPPLALVLALMLALATPFAYGGGGEQRAIVGFHDDEERTIHPFTIYHADPHPPAAAGGGGGGKNYFRESTFTPRKNYLLDRATGDVASPIDIGEAEPKRQSHTLECPSDRDFVNAEARSYDRRARESTRRNRPLHYQSKWRYFTLREWVYYVQCTTAHLADKFEPGQIAFDSGIGAGAFVKALDAVHPGMEFYGTDLSGAQVDFGNHHVYDRSFCMANSLNIHWVRDQFPMGFDHVLSNGVLHLAAEDYEQSFDFVQLMVDLARPGGYVWLGTVNDEDKRGDPDNENCYEWDGGSSDMFYSKRWWMDNMKHWGTFDLQIVDEGEACRALYTGDRCRYTVLMRKEEGPTMPPPKANRDEAMTLHVWKQAQLRKVARVLELLERREGGGKGCSCRTTNMLLGGLVLVLLGFIVIQQRRGGAARTSLSAMSSSNAKGHSL